MEQLVLRPDAMWAYFDLKEDFIYKKIPRQKRQYYVEAGVKAGQDQAKKYQGKDIRSLLEADDVEIRHFSDQMPIHLHSQICYDGKRKQIDIFTETAKALAGAMETTPYPISREEMEWLFLVHEFYHWLEYSGRVSTEQICEPVEIRTFGMFYRKAQVRRISEIAAFFFVKQWCHLKIHPKMMDYIFVYRQMGKNMEEIDQIFEKMEQEYKQECL